MRWQCQYHNSKGIRCAREAVHRLHFAIDHPFDHIDVCIEHSIEYRTVAWKQNLLVVEEEIKNVKAKSEEAQ